MRTGRTSLFISTQLAFTPASIVYSQHGVPSLVLLWGVQGRYCGYWGALQIRDSDFVFLFSPLRIATVPTDPGSMAQACGGDSKNPDS